MRPSVLSLIVLAGVILLGCGKRPTEPPVVGADLRGPVRAASSGDTPLIPPEVPPTAPAKAPRNLGAVVAVSNFADLAVAQTQRVSLLDITAMQGSHPPLSPTAAVRALEACERRYAGTSDVDQRLDLLDEIKQLAVPAVTQTLLNLLKLETTDDLKLSILDSVSGTWGTFEEKIEVLKEGLAGTQAGPVREAALDALIDLADPRTLPYVKALLDDPKPEVRDYARVVYRVMTETPK